MDTDTIKFDELDLPVMLMVVSSGLVFCIRQTSPNKTYKVMGVKFSPPLNLSCFLPYFLQSYKTSPNE